MFSTQIQGFSGLGVEGYVGKNCFSQEGCPVRMSFVLAKYSDICITGKFRIC